MDTTKAQDPWTSEAPDPWIGRTLAEKYRIETLIAAGGMGRVYRAVQEPLGRDVAVKVLSPRTGDGRLKEEFRQRFFREAATCARLQHPNTVTLFDYGQLDTDTVYMVMELVKGQTLKDLLRESRYLDAGRALRIAHEIAQSLREAHRIGVVHRDLKPSNVMVNSDRDGRDQVKVLDFGLVKLLDPETSSSAVLDDVRRIPGVEELSAVRKGVVVGSPGYMSPEQIEERPVDRRSDIYALGVILFECLTGEPPFKGVNAIETLMLHVTRLPPRVGERNPRVVVPDEVEKIVATCLQKDPARRFQRVDDVIDAIRHAMPPDLVDYDPLSKSPAPVDRNRNGSPWWSAPAFAFFALLALMSALALPSFLADPEPPPPPTSNLEVPRVTVSSIPPGATLFLDGTRVGTTPIALSGRDQGEIELRLQGYEAERLTLEPTDRDRDVHLTLRPTAPTPEPAAPPEPAPVPVPKPPEKPIFTER